jgi:hypothetical protein
MKKTLFGILLLLAILAVPTRAQSGRGVEDVNTFSVLLMTSVTPSNTDSVYIQGKYPRALYVGVSGDVSITTLSGTTITLVGLAAGIWHPVMFKRVRSTGTTATSILAGR